LGLSVVSEEHKQVVDKVLDVIEDLKDERYNVLAGILIGGLRAEGFSWPEIRRQIDDAVTALEKESSADLTTMCGGG
jgi:hypothetical protein